MRAVIHECDNTEAEHFRSVIVEGVVQPTVAMLHQIISRGIERGEVREDAADDYVYDAIPAMLMYRSKICGSEWSDREVGEMLDRLMVPLLRPAGS